MRCGELLALRWGDVSLEDPETESGAVRVRRTLTRTEDGKGIALGDSKTKKSGRTVRLTPGTRDALKRHRTRQAEEKLKAGSAYQDGDLLCHHVRHPDQPLEPPQSLVRPPPEECRPTVDNLPRSQVHDRVPLVLLKNVHPKFVQELLRHASVAFTLDTYSHMLPGMGGEAADAMDEALG
jgi:integrase